MAVRGRQGPPPATGDRLDSGVHLGLRPADRGRRVLPPRRLRARRPGGDRPVTGTAGREQRENDWFADRFDEIADAMAPFCVTPEVNEGYRLMFALRERVRQLEQMTCPFAGHGVAARCASASGRLA